MKKFFILLLMAASLDAMAQNVSMRDVFKQMPDSIVGYLTDNNRLDFIDFIDSQMDAEVTNSLGGKSRMLKLTDDFLHVSLSEASSLTMKLLPVSNPVDSIGQIVCLVRTYGKEAPESTVSFYSLKWRKLEQADYMDWPVDGMYVAVLDDTSDTLVIEQVSKLDAPADETQKEINKTSTKLKWEGRFVTES